MLFWPQFFFFMCWCCCKTLYIFHFVSIMYYNCYVYHSHWYFLNIPQLKNIPLNDLMCFICVELFIRQLSVAPYFLGLIKLPSGQDFERFVILAWRTFILNFIFHFIYSVCRQLKPTHLPNMCYWLSIQPPFLGQTLFSAVHSTSDASMRY